MVTRVAERDADAGQVADGAMSGVGSAAESRLSTRAELRRIAAEKQRRERSRRALWRAWWLYPLLVAIATTVYLGYRSASTPAAPGPTVITTVPSGS